MAAFGLNPKVNMAKMTFATVSDGGGGSLKTKASSAVATATRSSAIVKPSTSSASAPLFGVGAQRSKVGSGQHLNAKGFYSNTNASWLRAANNTTHFSTDFGMPQFAHHVHNNNNKMSGLEIAALSIAGLNALTGIVGEFAGSTSTKEVKGTDKMTGGQGTPSTQTTSNTSLGEMKSADNSTALSAAIDKAQADSTAIPTKLQAANSELANLTGQTKDLEANMNKTAEDLKANTDAIKAKSGEINTLKNSVIEGCKKSYESSKSNYEALQNKYDSTIDPTMQRLILPELNIAKTMMEQAKAKLEDAEAKLETADAELKGLQEQTKGLDQAAGDAKDAYNTNLEDIKTKQNDIKQLEQDKKDFEKEIPKQQKRLDQMKQKEDKELTNVVNNITKLQGEIDKLRNSINVNDENGLSKGEIKNKEKADKKQAELDKLKEKQADLQKRQAIRNLPTEHGANGEQLKAGLLPDGSQVYLVNGKEVTKEQYDAAKVS